MNHDGTIHTEDEILARVYRRGRALRLRRRLARGASSLTMLALLTGGMVFAASRTPQDKPPSTDALHEPEDPKPPKPAPSPKPSPDEPSPKPSESQKPESKPAPKPTEEPDPKPSPTESDCLNSFDPACGYFEWVDKPEPNQPLVITVNVPDAVAGEDAAFGVRVSDADAKIFREFWKVDFGDGSYSKGYGDKSCTKAYGPWTLPSRLGDVHETAFHHTYAAAGTYTVTVHYHSYDRRDGKRPCQQAYGSESTVQVTVTVTEPAPPPPPSPSPSPEPSPSPSPSAI